jgi:hypothetical protein
MGDKRHLVSCNRVGIHSLAGHRCNGEAVVKVVVGVDNNTVH